MYPEYLLNLQAVLYVGGGMSVPHIFLQNLRKKAQVKTTFNIKRWKNNIIWGSDLIILAGLFQNRNLGLEHLVVGVDRILTIFFVFTVI
jgi:hypothetical protein